MVVVVMSKEVLGCRCAAMDDVGAAARGGG